MDPVIATERAGRVLTVTLDRPRQLNALNSRVLEELHGIIEAVGDDRSVGCVVIQGAGDRAFCAGADLDEIRGLRVEEALAFIRRGQRTMTAVAESGVPVIAKVDGFALGGGFELVLACHLVVASDRSHFGLPEALIGCIPGFGGTQRLAAAVGKPAANLMMLSGDRVDAARAAQVGLLSLPPVPADDLDSVTNDLAARIAGGSRTGLRNLLEAARRSIAPAALEHEAALAALSIASRDGQEGIASFAERRAPVFNHEES